MGLSPAQLPINRTPLTHIQPLSDHGYLIDTCSIMSVCRNFWNTLHGPFQRASPFLPVCTVIQRLTEPSITCFLFDLIKDIPLTISIIIGGYTGGRKIAVTPTSPYDSRSVLVRCEHQCRYCDGDGDLEDFTYRFCLSSH